MVPIPSNFILITRTTGGGCHACNRSLHICWILKHFFAVPLVQLLHIKLFIHYYQLDKIHRLEYYLATKINRTETPWLVTIMHAPWYNSNTGHWMEGTYVTQQHTAIHYIISLKTLSLELICFLMLQPN